MSKPMATKVSTPLSENVQIGTFLKAPLSVNTSNAISDAASVSTAVYFERVFFVFAVN